MTDDITGTRAHLQARARERANQAARELTTTWEQRRARWADDDRYRNELHTQLTGILTSELDLSPADVQATVDRLIEAGTVILHSPYSAEGEAQAARGAAAIDSQVADASVETQVANALAALRVERP